MMSQPGAPVPPSLSAGTSNSARTSNRVAGSPPDGGGKGRLPERRILALVLPDLLNELVLQSLREAPAGTAVASVQRTMDKSALPLSPGSELDSLRFDTGRQRTASAAHPRAVVLTEPLAPPWDSKTVLDAVNQAAHDLGVYPRQTIAQANALVEHLSIHALPRVRVDAALKQVAEVALGFGSPVSIKAPDTIWVDISGSLHLFAGEREVASELISMIKSLGYTARAAVGPGPWVAQAFARHAAADAAGISRVGPVRVEQEVGKLPILALPIDRDAIVWFSRLGLLTIADLRTLPRAAVAARLAEFSNAGVEGMEILDLMDGHDAGILIPYYPDEMPREELTWDEPLESVEPLLFVLKGLSARLSARLEGRGQAVQDVLLTIHYDRAIAALRGVEPVAVTMGSETIAVGGGSEAVALGNGSVGSYREQLPFRLASPLSHAEDIERIVRARLLRQSLAAPAIGLSLQATSVTDVRHTQLGLEASMGLASDLSRDPRSMTLLLAELAADVGSDAVGVLVEHDSHLMEKSSGLTDIQNLKVETGRVAEHRLGSSIPLTDQSVLQLPTRILPSPIELKTTLQKSELVVLQHRPFIIGKIQFDHRLEAIEWWEPKPIYRDYFRVWLSAVSFGASSGVQSSALHGELSQEGVEALVYLDRASGKAYMHALYD
jgi:hypothetical protein